MPDPKKKKVVKGKNPKNKNILDTKIKNIPKSLLKKTKQKIKNAKNSTPKQLLKKVVKTVAEKSVPVRLGRAIRKKVNKVRKNTAMNSTKKMDKIGTKKLGVRRGRPSLRPRGRRS